MFLKKNNIRYCSLQLCLRRSIFLYLFSHPLLLIFAMIYLLSISTVQGGVAVSPLQQQIDMKPGHKAEFFITLSNVRRSPQQEPQKLQIELVDFTVTLDGTLKFGEEYKHNRSAIQWITLDIKELVLEPDKERKIKGTITAPYQVEGDYWCAVMITQPPPTKGPGVNVALRTACGIFVRVNRRNYIERFSIEKTEVSLPDFQTKDSKNQSNPSENLKEGLQIYADVKNTGIISCLGLGTASIYSENGRKTASIPMHSNRRHIQPGHTRQYQGVMSAPLPPGDYTIKFIFDSVSKRGRKAVEGKKLHIDTTLAQEWDKQSKDNPEDVSLKVDPANIEKELANGRFTTIFISVSNPNSSTLRANCELQTDSALKKWFQIESKDFTLAPGMRHSIVNHINIPKSALSGDYEGKLILKVQKAGLSEQNNEKVVEIPIKIKVIQ